MTNKPIIFISYSQLDEPETPADGEVQWLSFVRRSLQPAVKYGVFDLFVDRGMIGGEDWEPEIERKLRDCDIFILLVSDNSLASDYVVDKEIPIIRERQAREEDVHFYPLLLTPTADAGLKTVKDKNLRPPNGKPFSSFSDNARRQHMTNAANEIAKIAEQIAARKAASSPATASVRPAYVHIAGLPETAYERLVGRDAQLQRLDAAWADPKINILSLIAEGGAGKSALVNEWLKRMQADNYRGAASVLGWSFYSQGTKERATSADAFLDWAVDKLAAKPAANSAVAKGEAIAEAMMRRRALLVLDGVEPLQHGPDGQLGQLKDPGLRALLRRFAATPPAEPHGLIVLTSRLAVADIARWKDGAAPVVDVERLSDEAGAALLRDNGVWGTDKQLKDAAHDFGGHPLALGLLASFLGKTQFGDVRRRDLIRAYLRKSADRRHDHARRVMESYEKEWLVGEPVLHAIMHMIGLFDRPASGDCLAALRAEPTIPGFTEAIAAIDESEWRDAVARLREARLLAPPDPAAPEALDAHPLVREWFGERLRQANEAAWKAAHGRLYEHLRDTTKEGKTPTLSDLAPLYQAIAHGCRAGRHQEALDEIYRNRICRRQADGRVEFYSFNKLGAFGSDLAAISWFFVAPYTSPVDALSEADRAWALSVASYSLRAQGRIAEAMPAWRGGLRMEAESSDWRNAAITASMLSQSELLVGAVPAAVTDAEQSVDYADRSGDEFLMAAVRAFQAGGLHAAGLYEPAQRLFAEAERRHNRGRPDFPLLSSTVGYLYCDLLLSTGEHEAVVDRVTRTLKAKVNPWPRDAALINLALARARILSALTTTAGRQPIPLALADAPALGAAFGEAVEGLRAAGTNDELPRGLLARAAFLRSIGDWDGAARDLDEVEEIAEPGPMRLFLCDRALERARLAFARLEAFAPLNGLVDASPPKPALPDAAEAARLRKEARADLDVARKLIADCGYHRRDEELAELDAVLAGARSFADLPPRV